MERWNGENELEDLFEYEVERFHTHIIMTVKSVSEELIEMVRSEYSGTFIYQIADSQFNNNVIRIVLDTNNSGLDFGDIGFRLPIKSNEEYTMAYGLANENRAVKCKLTAEELLKEFTNKYKLDTELKEVVYID